MSEMQISADDEIDKNGAVFGAERDVSSNDLVWAELKSLYDLLTGAGILLAAVALDCCQAATAQSDSLQSSAPSLHWARRQKPRKSEPQAAESAASAPGKCCSASRYSCAGNKPGPSRIRDGLAKTCIGSA